MTNQASNLIARFKKSFLIIALLTFGVFANEPAQAACGDNNIGQVLGTIVCFNGKDLNGCPCGGSGGADYNGNCTPTQIATNPLVINGPQSFGVQQSNDTFWCVAQQRSDTTHTELRRIFYLMAGIAIIAFSILAAIGKFQWKWLFMMTGGLFLAAGFQKLIDFLN